MLWAGAQGRSRITDMLSTRPMVFVGLISYSLYLWHWPILAFTRLYLGRLDLAPLVAAMAVATAFTLSVATWAFVERPFRRRPPAGLPRHWIFWHRIDGDCPRASASRRHLAL